MELHSQNNLERKKNKKGFILCDFNILQTYGNHDSGTVIDLYTKEIELKVQK